MKEIIFWSIMGFIGVCMFIDAFQDTKRPKTALGAVLTGYGVPKSQVARFRNCTNCDDIYITNFDDVKQFGWQQHICKGKK